MADEIPLREYARRKGVSLTAVQNAIKSGRITPIRDADGGRIKGIDWATQENAWEANSKHPQKRPHTIGGGRPRLDGQPPAPPAARQQQAQDEAGVVSHLEGQPNGGALLRNQKVEPPTPPGQMSLADIQRARELVKLQIDNEKLKEVRGESVSAAEQEKQGRNLAAIVISGLYSIPDRISDELAGMSDPHAIAELLRQQIDASVSELRKAYEPAAH